jgi:hypothetical protein
MCIKGGTGQTLATVKSMIGMINAIFWSSQIFLFFQDVHNSLVGTVS